MNLLKATLAQIQSLDEVAMKQAGERLNALTKPAGSLGRLEQIVVQFAGITGEKQPQIPRKCIVIACADHGVAEVGVSAYPVETTVAMTKNYLIAKGAGANALAGFCNAEMVVADFGVAADLTTVPGLWPSKIAYGTKNFTDGPAMTTAQAIEAVEEGIKLAFQLAGQGYNCFALGEMGIGNTTASAAIAAVFLGLSPEEATGRGTGISDQRLAVKVDAVRRALACNKPNADDAIDVLGKVGGFELGGLAGIILGAAASRCIVVIDGFNATAAGLIADGLSPTVKDFMVASHLSAEPAHTKMLRRLGLRPYIDMGLRLGEATGAALAMDLLDVAIEAFNGMATFSEAGVSTKECSRENEEALN
jgi:nicotinate-nucleotide--dimethylbenzimidazole phosphoribosyltransferase